MFTAQTRLNETMVLDKGMNRFNKKVLLQKDKELEEKTKEVDNISRKYEAKINQLNKSRNQDREKYENQIKSLRDDVKTIKNRHKYKKRPITTRANTPVVMFD